MAVMDGESEMTKIWGLVAELSEQLSRMRQCASQLHNQSIKAKSAALNSETGFVLRRFNHHLTKEEYDTELERMNVAMSSENQGLQYDNKQLNSLLKEYEQTLDSVMTTFRKRAHDVQEQELNLIRQYESLITASESLSLEAQLTSDSQLSSLITTCSKLLRMVLRLLGGENPEPPSPPSDDLDVHGLSEDPVDYAMDRETELARLEKENEELRLLLKAAEAAENSRVPLELPKVPLAVIKQQMPKRTRHQQHHSFGSESSMSGFVPEQQHPLHELQDMSDDTEVL